jgi:hypothetical protein
MVLYRPFYWLPSSSSERLTLIFITTDIPSTTRRYPKVQKCVTVLCKYSLHTVHVLTKKLSDTMNPDRTKDDATSVGHEFS